MKHFFDTIVQIVRLYLGDPNLIVAKYFLLAGIALVATEWWVPLIFAAAEKYLALSSESLRAADTTTAIYGWILIAIGLFLYFYAKSRSGTVAEPIYGVSFIEGDASIRCDTITENSGELSIEYFPEMAKLPQFSDCRRFRIEINGEFFNDTETQRVLRNPVLHFWGVEGLRITAQNPTFMQYNPERQEWELNTETRTITIPPRSLKKIRFSVGLGAEFDEIEQLIDEIYSGTVVLMSVEIVNVMQQKFRICTRSFCGPTRVVWPPDREYPIYNILSLNQGGRASGRRPQSRNLVAETIRGINQAIHEE